MPLSLPEGSVRAILALMIVGGLLFCIITGIEAPQFLIDSSLTIIGYYVGYRSSKS